MINRLELINDLLAILTTDLRLNQELLEQANESLNSDASNNFPDVKQANLNRIASIKLSGLKLKEKYLKTKEKLILIENSEEYQNYFKI